MGFWAAQALRLRHLVHKSPTPGQPNDNFPSGKNQQNYAQKPRVFFGQVPNPYSFSSTISDTSGDGANTFTSTKTRATFRHSGMGRGREEGGRFSCCDFSCRVLVDFSRSCGECFVGFALRKFVCRGVVQRGSVRTGRRTSSTPASPCERSPPVYWIQFNSLDKYLTSFSIII